MGFDGIIPKFIKEVIEMVPADLALSTVDIVTFIGIILVALATIWPAKKLISFGNKS